MDLLIRRVLRGLAWAVLLAWNTSSPAQAPGEYAVKAAYLFKFGDFVEWPSAALPKPGKPFVIGILGEDPFGSVLDDLVRSHTIQGRPIQVRRYQRPEDVWEVQILFLGRMSGLEQKRAVRELEGLSLLTVCDADLHPTAVLRFVTQGKRVRFEANLDEAEARQLKLSSKILSLAASVKPPLPAGER